MVSFLDLIAGTKLRDTRNLSATCCLIQQTSEQFSHRGNLGEVGACLSNVVMTGQKRVKSNKHKENYVKNSY